VASVIQKSVGFFNYSYFVSLFIYFVPNYQLMLQVVIGGKDNFARAILVDELHFKYKKIIKYLNKFLIS
jgi:hypothetical protein